MLIVTPTAAQTVRDLLVQRQIPDHVLRVFVQGGGCSGMQYGMAFEAAPESSDVVVEVEGTRFVVDPISMQMLQGATIDFVDSLMGGGFRIENPNAVSSCGCGHSFHTADSDDDSGESCSCGCGCH
ncbi:MAG: iron-sulfur cluster assembly accessory protein [Chloroflexi bacterium]|nr:iron-sulfur cluster assembly accessory protein [Chloroflexota bacterium]MBW7878747.1 iron-sulfur cluster assembly accessory protein [Anaerolineae bacterium]MDL1917601.1 iron-sulfur cluster assembly accessory protein [Anaerolineae bacterium CFX4]OQY79447.1 MAG: iron-sulfur cluster assembly accessory protein [Anaerolineae bacterium UTCFX5]MCC6565124.1 iron-sulfur cluster assembly accessory protein [Chloroflexota bacterium]